MTENFSKKIYAGVSWTLLSSAANQVLNLVRSVMLARLLSQEDFGIAGMATTVLGAVCVLTNIGVNSSAITAKFKDEEEQRKYVDTIWTMELGRGFFIGLFMSLAAFPTSLFYHDHRLLPVVLVLSWVPFTGSLRNMGLGLMARDMQFGRFTIVNLVETVVSVLAAIFLAWWLRSYWSLVLAQAGAAIFGLILSYAFHPYRPQLKLDPTAVKAGFKFGKHIFFIGLATFIVTTMDNVFLGRLLGATVLGTYLIAFGASSLLTNIVGQVLGMILFPTFAHLQRERPERLELGITRALTVGSLLLTIGTVPFILLAPDIITVLYGPKWLAAAAPMRLLAMAGFLRGMLGLLSPIAMGLARPDIESRTKIVEAAIFLTTIYPMVKYLGMMGAAITGILTFSVSLLLQYILFQKNFAGSLNKLPRLMAISLFSIMVGFFAAHGPLSLLTEQHPVVRILVGTFTSLTSSVLSFCVIWPQAETELLSVVGALRRRAVSASNHPA